MRVEEDPVVGTATAGLKEVRDLDHHGHHGPESVRQDDLYHLGAALSLLPSLTPPPLPLPVCLSPPGVDVDDGRRLRVAAQRARPAPHDDATAAVAHGLSQPGTHTHTSETTASTTTNKIITGGGDDVIITIAAVMMVTSSSSSSSPGACPAAPSSSTRIRRGKGGQSVSSGCHQYLSHTDTEGEGGVSRHQRRTGLPCVFGRVGRQSRSSSCECEREGGERERQFSVSVVASRVNSSQQMRGGVRERERVGQCGVSSAPCQSEREGLPGGVFRRPPAHHQSITKYSSIYGARPDHNTTHEQERERGEGLSCGVGGREVGGRNEM